MKFRSARHTNDLPVITAFYTENLGLQVLGSFEGHDGYDGIFLGIPGENWHLEFTSSAESATHHPDDDDLLVFYPASTEEFEKILQRFRDNSFAPETPKNPYWQDNGTMYRDPDGFGIIVVQPG